MSTEYEFHNVYEFQPSKFHLAKCKYELICLLDGLSFDCKGTRRGILLT